MSQTGKRVYVASKFNNKDAVRECQRQLMLAGHTITHDWTGETDTGLEGAAKTAFWRVCAHKDVCAAYEADVLILICVPEMRGAWFEFGVAVAANRPCILIGSAHETVFTEHELVTHVDTIEEAVAKVNAL